MVSAFISYRRSGGAQYVQSIIEHFQHRHQNIHLFRDTDFMVPGRFEEQIRENISKSSCLIVVLTKDALAGCERENDWIRKEISWAIEYNKIIIPLITNDFVWPEKLPDAIHALKDYHGIPLMTDSTHSFEMQMDQLAKGILLANKANKKPRISHCLRHPLLWVSALVLLALIVFVSYLSGFIQEKSYLEASSAQGTSQLNMTVVLNGRTLQDLDTYEVKAGDIIHVTAGSSVAQTQRIGYFFIADDPEIFIDTPANSFDNLIDIYADNIEIILPDVSPETSTIQLHVEAVADNDDGTPNTITKTGWQIFYLKYTDSE